MTIMKLSIWSQQVEGYAFQSSGMHVDLPSPAQVIAAVP